MLLSYLPPPALVVQMDKKTDERGHLFELLKTDGSGQVFMSVTHPGVTRGNHYHHHKVERFFVVSGEARITLRHMVTNEVSEFLVRGEDCRAVDIPAGSTHAITNVGAERDGGAVLGQRDLRSGPPRHVLRGRSCKIKVMTVVGTRPEIIRLSRVMARARPSTATTCSCTPARTTTTS